jgi:hypothetical protein
MDLGLRGKVVATERTSFAIGLMLDGDGGQVSGI